MSKSLTDFDLLTEAHKLSEYAQGWNDALEMASKIVGEFSLDGILYHGEHEAGPKRGEITPIVESVLSLKRGAK